MYQCELSLQQSPYMNFPSYQCEHKSFIQIKQKWEKITSQKVNLFNILYILVVLINFLTGLIICLAYH